MHVNEWINIGRRAVACESWVWLAGMLAISTKWKPGTLVRLHSVRPCEDNPNDLECRWIWDRGQGLILHYNHCGAGFNAPNGFVPDFRDPATIECVAGHVRSRQEILELIDALEGTDRLSRRRHE